MLSFAVVIPNLNQSHFLGTALESLKYQAVPFELAVVDGGSTDDFHEVVEKYSDIITFMRSENDKGQAAAIREGNNIISGDIVAWLNADDYYFPGTLERVAACFEEDPELDVVYGDAVHVSPEGFFLSYFPPIQEFNANDLTRTCFICQPTCFVRRSAYERLGGVDADLHYTMDWDLWCRLSNSGVKFCYLHEVLAAVRYYPGTKTLSRNWKRYMEIWRIERKYGHRLLPLSWPGFYFYDLTFKTEKTMTEQAYFYILNLLRRVKKSIFRTRYLAKGDRQTIYGFHRWDNVVQGNCTIFLPWYDTRRWSKLCVKIKPPHNRYRIQINGEPCWYKVSEQGFLVADVPPLKAPCREISIQCPEKAKWRLLGFSCDLVGNDPG